MADSARLLAPFAGVPDVPSLPSGLVNLALRQHGSQVTAPRVFSFGQFEQYRANGPDSQRHFRQPTLSSQKLVLFQFGKRLSAFFPILVLLAGQAGAGGAGLPRSLRLVDAPEGR